jgi:hypothetical protein
VALVSTALGALWLADAYASDATTYCSTNLRPWQWLGCAMAAHEGLAAGLIGAAGALFAGWLAFDAIQEQLLEERERDDRRRVAEEEHRRSREREAKEAAVVCIAQPVHAAAAALALIGQALHATREYERRADDLIKLAAEHTAGALNSFVVRESMRDLDIDDRLLYLTIVGTLNAFVSVSERPSPALTRNQRLEGQRDILMKLHRYLQVFDSELASVFARDSNTEPPTQAVAAPR